VDKAKRFSVFTGDNNDENGLNLPVEVVLASEAERLERELAEVHAANRSFDATLLAAERARDEARAESDARLTSWAESRERNAALRAENARLKSTCAHREAFRVYDLVTKPSPGDLEALRDAGKGERYDLDAFAVEDVLRILAGIAKPAEAK
jgi:hypothetical protein